MFIKLLYSIFLFLNSQNFFFFLFFFYLYFFIVFIFLRFSKINFKFLFFVLHPLFAVNPKSQNFLSFILSFVLRLQSSVLRFQTPLLGPPYFLFLHPSSSAASSPLSLPSLPSFVLHLPSFALSVVLRPVFPYPPLVVTVRRPNS